MNPIEYAVGVVISQTFLVTFVLLLARFKEPERKWKGIWLVFALLITAANLCIILAGFIDFYERMWFFTMTLWHFVLLYIVSAHSGWRVAFNIFTVLFAATLPVTVSSLVEIQTDRIWLIWLSRLMCLVLVCPLVVRMKKSYLRMLDLLERGWAILCSVPCLICLLISRVYLLEDRLSFSMLAFIYLTLLALGFAFYGVVWLFFGRVQDEHDARENAHLLHLQMSALQNRMDDIKSMEDKLRIERHDLRHRFNALSVLITEGNTEKALGFIRECTGVLDDLSRKTLCANPVLDAVFSAYFAQAEKAGIKVDARISLPRELPVDAGELSTVFANALENAIHAAAACPKKDRQIHCICLSSPQLMFKISNTCVSKVVFDTDGYPVSARAGHGIGTRSIKAFVNKHDALCTYDADNGWFKLTIVM